MAVQSAYPKICNSRPTGPLRGNTSASSSGTRAEAISNRSDGRRQRQRQHAPQPRPSIHAGDASCLRAARLYTDRAA
jgi:hypothetical protein